MATERTIFALTPDTTAATDLRSYQFRPVVFDAGGVRPAGANIGSGPVWVLGNRPNSGQAATIYGPPNVVKAIAGSTIIRGGWIIVAGSAFVQTSDAMWISSLSALIVGTAFEAVSSGNIFALALR